MVLQSMASFERNSNLVQGVELLMVPADEPRAPAAHHEPDRGNDQQMISALRAGDEVAFAALLDQYHLSMVRLATHHVRSRAVAEDVVQETWIGVLRGLDRFEGRSSLKTWLFSILMNQARRRGAREGRSVPFSALARAETESNEPAVGPEWFRPEGEAWAGYWSSYPSDWRETPEDRLLSSEVRTRINLALESLPPAQREVMTLRDVEGWSAEEVCNVLELTRTNQRVLLHRARSKVRRAIEPYLEGS